MKVAYFSGTMLKDQDGVARVLYHWIEQLTRHEIKSIFVTASGPLAKEKGANVHKVPSLAFPLNRLYRLAIPGSAFFSKKISRFRPDIIHINSPCSLGLAAASFGNKNNIPVVATYHTNFTSYMKYYNLEVFEPVIWLYLRSVYKKCEKVYVPTMPTLLELKRHGLKRLELMPHGVDSRVFNAKYRSEKWRSNLRLNNKIIVLYVGRLVWEKDLKILAKAYSILEKNRKLAFVIVGDGPVMKDLKELMPKARFLGKLVGRPLATAYASSDIFAFPSTTETFGNVAIEAMISGLACVCANKGGTKGIIEDNVTGFLAKPLDPRDFAGKIQYLATHPKKRIEMAQAGLEYAKKQTWEDICTRLFNNYTVVIQKHSAKKNAAKTKKR